MNEENEENTRMKLLIDYDQNKASLFDDFKEMEADYLSSLIGEILGRPEEQELQNNSDVANRLRNLDDETLAFVGDLAVFPIIEWLTTKKE